MPFIRKNPPEWDRLLEKQGEPRSGLHVTDCLGCPRRTALLREAAPVDLSRLESRLSGSITHSALASVNPETAEVPVSGTLLGYEMVGSIDRLEDGFVCDYKAGEGKGEGKQIPDAPYPEQVWQMEAYRYLLAYGKLHGEYAPYMGKWLTKGWRIYYRWDKAWWMYEHIGALWADASLESFRPHGGAFTAGDIARQHVQGGPAASLPLVGATQRIGRGSACEWCEVQSACDAAGMEIDL